MRNEPVGSRHSALSLSFNRHAVTLFERIFEPQTVLPCQQPRPVSPYAGAQSLAVAVLVQAIRDLQCRDGALSWKARQWFHGRGYSILTFENACDWIGVDIEWLRPKILSGELRKLPRHGSPFRSSYRESQAEEDAI